MNVGGETLRVNCGSLFFPTRHRFEASNWLSDQLQVAERAEDAVNSSCDEARAQRGIILLTAGGSAVFDLVVPLLRTQGLSRPVQGVLRSGCYVTHDHGNYKRFLQLVEKREGLDESLRPALEVWSMVQSVPEPGLALLTCGRRDISYDIEMPIPVRHAPRGTRELSAVPADWKIAARVAGISRRRTV